MNVLCITNRKLCKRQFLEQIRVVASQHPWGIVLREKDLSLSEYKALSLKVLDICAIENVRLILHGIDEVSPDEITDFILDHNASSKEKFAGVHFSMGDFQNLCNYSDRENYKSNYPAIENAISGHLTNRHLNAHMETPGNHDISENEKLFCTNIEVSQKNNVLRNNNSLFRIFLGVSAHSLEDALFCEEHGASYITASHIFPTDCKKGVPPRGIPFLKEICGNTKIPVFALGGINHENATDCIQAGAFGVSVMSGCMKW